MNLKYGCNAYRIPSLFGLVVGQIRRHMINFETLKYPKNKAFFSHHSLRSTLCPYLVSITPHDISPFLRLKTVILSPVRPRPQILQPGRVHSYALKYFDYIRQLPFSLLLRQLVLFKFTNQKMVLSTYFIANDILMQCVLKHHLKKLKSKVTTALDEQRSATSSKIADNVEERNLGLWVFYPPHTSESLQPVPNDTPAVSSSTPSLPLVDIIFVHGLGGRARDTWVSPRGTFWPEWLPTEKGLSNIRLSTFGYKADFNKFFEGQNMLGIPGFAAQLLAAVYRHSQLNGNVSISIFLLS
jgi:hypothetical protein